MPRMGVVIFSLFVATFGLVTATKRYDGWSLIKAKPKNETQLEYVNSLGSNETGDQVEIWLRGSLKRPFDIFVSPSAKEAILAKMRELEIAYVITAENMQRSIDAERVSMPSDARLFASINNSDLFTKYLSLDEMNKAVKRLARDNPNIVKVSSIGKTHEKRSITLVTVSSGDSDSKPAIWLDGGIHAREWISPATVLFILNKLVADYGSNSTIKKYVDNATFYIVPIMNPDGYQYTFEKERMWRKNRRPKDCNTTGCCEGVDLNRNFDHNFGGPGTSPRSCAEDYHGPSAFSEPETAAVRDFLTSHKNVRAFINVHAYSQLWFYPYASPANTYPPDVKELEAIAKRGAELLASKHGTKFEVGTPSDLLYEAAGGSFDWAKDVAGIKYCFALELRPSGTTPIGGFVLPPSEIVPSGEETFAGLSVVFDAVVGAKPDAGK